MIANRVEKGTGPVENAQLCKPAGQSVWIDQEIALQICEDWDTSPRESPGAALTARGMTTTKEEWNV